MQRKAAEAFFPTCTQQMLGTSEASDPEHMMLKKTVPTLKNIQCVREKLIM